MSNSLAPVIISDKAYKDADMISWRVYQSIAAGNIVFIDSTYDVNRRIFKIKDHQDFAYVTSRADVEYRLSVCKSNPKVTMDILQYQWSSLCHTDKSYFDLLHKAIRFLTN
jgi:hypothetical protein